MTRVVIETPYCEKKNTYLREAINDCVKRHESPIPGYVMKERTSWDWVVRADLIAVYVDNGITPEMDQAIEAANRFGIEVDYRSLKNRYENNNNNIENKIYENI